MFFLDQTEEIANRSTHIYDVAELLMIKFFLIRDPNFDRSTHLSQSNLAQSWLWGWNTEDFFTEINNTVSRVDASLVSDKVLKNLGSFEAGLAFWCFYNWTSLLYKNVRTLGIALIYEFKALIHSRRIMSMIFTVPISVTLVPRTNLTKRCFLG